MERPSRAECGWQRRQQRQKIIRRLSTYKRQPENAFPRFQAAFMLFTNAYALSNAFCSALYAACISRSRLVAWRSIK